MVKCVLCFFQPVPGSRWLKKANIVILLGYTVVDTDRLNYDSSIIKKICINNVVSLKNSQQFIGFELPVTLLSFG